MKISKSKLILSVSVIGWAMIAFILFGTASVDAANNRDNEDVYKKMRLFTEVFAKVKDNYVDELSVDELIDAAIKGMLDVADPHTVYFDPDDFEKFTSSTQGEFGGLGISIDKKGDYITVVSPIEGTPAYRMGILAGDKISTVDGISVVGMNTDESIKLMRGEPGTKVKIGILRPGVKEMLEFEIIRDIIKINSVPYSFVTDNEIGYLRIRQFNKNTTKELRASLDELEKEDLNGLLIDLRSNPGGLLTEAVNTVNEFIGKGKRVVFTKGRAYGTSEEFYTTYDVDHSGYPIVILVNEASASASEIFAGSLQDYDRGLVVGKTTFGKGSVQRLFPLSNGNGVKVTTAKYYINSGRCIHKDINDELYKDPRVLSGEMTIEEIREKQAEAAEESKDHIYYTEKGRVVYGGGGITPDVEIEQSLLTDLGVDVRRRNTIFDFTVDYMQKHEDEVTLQFEADEAMIEDFWEFARSKDIEFDSAAAEEINDWVKVSIEAGVIEKRFGQQEGYKRSIQHDTQLQEALELFEKYQTLDEMFEYSASLKEDI
jgi:carboxyl-terminal processing protease